MHGKATTAVLELLGEASELSVGGQDDAALEHVMRGAMQLTHGSALWRFVVDTNGGEAVATQTRIMGLDAWQLRTWETSFLEVAAYRAHPMWERVVGARGLDTFRREDIMSDREWRKSPHMAVALGYGVGDNVASVAPLGDGRLAVLVVARALSDGRFDAHDGVLLHQLHRGATWLQRRVTKHLDRCELIDALAPRHRAVLDHLLSGKTEKQIAAALKKSRFTIHKYIEAIYATLGVSSRAELMARFIETPHRGPP